MCCVLCVVCCVVCCMLCVVLMCFVVLCSGADDALCLRVGDDVAVVSDADADWLLLAKDGKEGYYPRNYAEIITGAFALHYSKVAEGKEEGGFD